MEKNFESLTPKNDIDISTYEEALSFALAEKTITNIALTGPYGAGKSSVIESYKMKHPEKGFMNISLTHFEGNEATGTNILEGKIINQLLHQIDYNKIPQTIFKIKNNTKKSTLWKYTILILVFICSALLVVKFKNWTRYLNGSFTNKNSGKLVMNLVKFLSSEQFNLIVLCIFTGSIVFFMYSIIKFQINKQFLKKITIKGNEIEIFQDQNESYFDKFMNDVIYLFTSSGKNVVIFEDLDRFNNPTIYERLYEINLLVNKRLAVNKKKNQIKFIYLIKDDAFTSKDRTKLFDFIIPIIPVIDSSNSFEQFIQTFKDAGISNDFDIKVLRKLSLYIDDMRLLKNISNEYLIYKDRLSEITLDNNKLLATIIYKNLFPKDFSKFQLGIGFINEIFSKKSSLIQDIIEKIEKQISNLEKQLEDSEIETLNSVNELDALFLKNPTDGFYTVNEKKESDFENRSDFIAAIKNNSFDVKQATYTSGYYSSELKTTLSAKNISGIFEELKDKKEYLVKLNNLNNKESTKRTNLINKKEELKLRMEKVYSESMSDVLLSSEIDLNDFINKLECDENLIKSPYFDLIIFIVREGLIDENYTDYLTYFYENNLNIEDKEFLRGIYDRRPKEWTYSLTNFDRITTELSVEELIRFKVLNLDLSIFYIENMDKYDSEVTAIFNVIRNSESSVYILDIYERFKEEKKLLNFFGILESKWNLVLKDLISLNLEKRLKIEEFIYIAIFYFSDSSVKDNDSTIKIKDFIEQSSDFEEYLKVSDIPSEDYLKRLSKLNIKFMEINATKIQTKKIVELNMFQLSENNLKNAFMVYELDINKRFYSDNISLLLSEEILKVNIYENQLNEYINLYLSLSNELLRETPEIIVELMNNPSLSSENSSGVIDRLELPKKINEINSVKDLSQRKMLFDSGNILVSEENIIEYFLLSENQVNDSLVDKINTNNIELNFQTIKGRYAEEILSSLYDNLVIKNSIDTHKYISILKSFELVYKDGFNKEGIQIEKIKELILAGIIEVTMPNIVAIMKKYEEVVYAFVKRDMNTFIDVFGQEDCYNQSVLIKLIANENLTEKEKKGLIDTSKENISILNSSYPKDIKAYIVQHKFKESDLPELISSYANVNTKLQQAIYDRALENINIIIENEYVVDKALLVRLLLDEQTENKKLLFAVNVEMAPMMELRTNCSI
ncbi:hypothetical protein QTN56_04280 [Latilactobacillus sakei]|uniref:YobI family P-loop NTPase n=1 Tax=Latilactobacillus sakei TaxID=1599 RepID=UPI0025A57683|nr:hypothetical protein [Latilactobacillus sakei]MDM5044085.1 hypothetical protein [Latilactobacillus sakei]